MASTLAGWRIVSTRPETQISTFVTLLRELGAEPIIFPTISIQPIENNAPLEAALQTLSNYEWCVFTSVNGVNAVCGRMRMIGIDPAHLNNCQIAAIGPATAAELERYGVRVDLQPEEYIAEAIFTALAARGPLAGKHFLLLRADIARDTLRDRLIKHGAVVDEIPVYHTVRGTPDPAAYESLRAGVDIITFTSSSTVRHFFELLGDTALEIAQNARIACIGPITAQTARDLGLNVDLVADDYTIPGLVSAITERVSNGFSGNANAAAANQPSPTEHGS